MNSMMMISRVLGRSIISARSNTVGSRNSTRVRPQRKTLSKSRLKNWATITAMTRKRRAKYTAATVRLCRRASWAAERAARSPRLFFATGLASNLKQILIFSIAPFPGKVKKAVPQSRLRPLPHRLVRR